MGVLKCSLCSVRSESKAGLSGHYLRVHKASIGTFGCERCDFRTRTMQNLIGHVGVKHGGKRFKCSRCLYTTAIAACFRSHVLKEHGGDSEVMKCSECPYGASTRADLVRHLVKGSHPEKSRATGARRVRREGKSLVCVECGHSARWRSAIVHHVNTRHPRPRIRLDPESDKFFCTECKYSSKRKTSIAAHVNLRHKPPVEKFKCSQCPYTTKVETRLVKHEEKHSKTSKKGKRSTHKYKQFARDSEGLFRCTECDYSTKWRSSIIAHVDNYHNPDAEEYKCGQCSYKTRVKAYLQQHRVTHRIASTTGKKLKRTPRKYKQIVRDSELNVYRCSECEYSTKWRSSIIAHVDNYHNPDAEVYSCPKCAYTCKVKSYLAQHLLTHERGRESGRRVTGSSKYKQLSYDSRVDLFRCTDCDYSSKWRGSVIAHIGLRHTSDSAVYVCPRCPYSSKVKSYFVQHSRTHDAKPIKCEACSFVTKNKRLLEQHQKKCHPAWEGLVYLPVKLEPIEHIEIEQEVKVEPLPYMEESLMSEWSEESVPDVNSLEPSIEPSPDLSLAIEMNLNDHDLFPPPQEVGCPYCAYVTYSAEEMYQHMAIHQHPIHYYYTDQPVSL